MDKLQSTTAAIGRNYKEADLNKKNSSKLSFNLPGLGAVYEATDVPIVKLQVDSIPQEQVRTGPDPSTLGSIGANLVPASDVAYDLGTSTSSWRAIYVDQIYDENGNAVHVFKTINVPNGTAPVADSLTDALSLTSTGGSVTITGDALTDSINFDIPASVIHDEYVGHDLGSHSNTLAVETTLTSTTVGANTLTTNGDSLEFYAAGTFAATAATKQLRIKLGGTTLFDSGALAVTAALDWVLTGSVLRSGASAQKACFVLKINDATVHSVTDYSTGTESWGSNLNLVLTGQATNNADITCEIWKIIKSLAI